MDAHDLERLIQTTNWQDVGALSVPTDPQQETGPSQTLGYLWSQIAWSELGHPEATLDDVLNGIRQLPKAFWIPTIAAISVGLAKHGTAETQPELVHAFRGTPTGQRVHAAIDAAELGEKNRALFSPKPLAGLIKLVLAHAPGGDGTRSEGAAELFLQTYLKLCDVVEAANPGETDDPVRNLLRYWVQEGEHGAAGGAAEPFARMDGILRRIPDALGVDPSPSDHFEAAIGMPLGRFTALASAISAYTVAMDTNDPESINQHLQFDPSDLVRLTHATVEQVDAVFGALTISDGDVAAFQEEDPTAAPFYADLSRLKLHPLWAWDAPNGKRRYIPVSIPFLTWRITDGVYWDVVNAASAAAGGGKAGREASGQIMTDFGRYLEAYVGSLVERVMPSSPFLAPRFHAGLRLEGKAGGQSSEIDLLFPYEDAFVAVEIKSARFHYANSVIKGDLEYIEEEDLHKMLYGPAAQLEEAIDLLQANRYPLGATVYDSQPVYPVLVTYGSLPTLGPVWGYLLEQLREQGILQGPNVRPLAALGIDEVEVLLALVASGHTVRDVIRGYVEGDDAELSFRNYANRAYGDAANVRALLQPDYAATMERFQGLFRRDEQAPAPLS